MVERAAGVAEPSGIKEEPPIDGNEPRAQELLGALPEVARHLAGSADGATQLTRVREEPRFPSD